VLFTNASLPPSLPPSLPQDLSGIPTIVKFGILGVICLLSFAIRLFAVVRYESVIHEFDPYFNFRTTKVGREGGREGGKLWHMYAL
jgi:asparagine N-glycosylation enzyme membrane subunit Stt3